MFKKYFRLLTNTIWTIWNLILPKCLVVQRKGDPREEKVGTSCFEKNYNTFRFALIFLCGFDLKNHFFFKLNKLHKLHKLECVHGKHEVVGTNPTLANFLYGFEKLSSKWILYITANTLYTHDYLTNSIRKSVATGDWMKGLARN